MTAGNFCSVLRAEIEMLYACLARKIPATAVGLLRVRARRWHESFRWGEGMHTAFRFQVLQHVTVLISLARPLVEAIHRADRDLASQVRRALSSTGLNIAEAFGNDAGHARMRFRTARGSLYEAQAGIRLAIAWGHITEEQAQAALESLDSLGGRVYGLSKS